MLQVDGSAGTSSKAGQALDSFLAIAAGHGRLHGHRRSSGKVAKVVNVSFTLITCGKTMKGGRLGKGRTLMTGMIRPMTASGAKHAVSGVAH